MDERRADLQFVTFLTTSPHSSRFADGLPTNEFSPSTKCLYNLPMKPLRFVGSSLDDLRDFPAEARRQAGFELYAVQRALEPSDWKAMNAIGGGAKEIRIRVLGEWRVLYVAKFEDAVVCLARLPEEVS